LKVDTIELTLLTTHGRAVTESKKKLRAALRFKRDLLILADPSFDVTDICSFVNAQGFDGDVIVLEDLGYETEKVSYGRVVSPPKRQSRLFCILLRNLVKRRPRRKREASLS
jgi:precorrin-6B methylase 1